MTPATERFEPHAEEPRLFQAVQEYEGELAAGRRPDRSEFLARFPDLADALGQYLDALDMVHAAVPVLQQPPCKCPNSSAPELPLAEPLGDFRILREIGRGGMGIVYEAVQRSLGRRVALKVLPFAAALDARQLQRFKNEAQAAAHLHHSNIVPVYAVGAERGVHFYAMQMIEGQNLATLVQDLRRSSAPSTAEHRPEERPGPSSPPLLPPNGVTAPISPLGVQLSTQRSNRSTDFFRTVARLTAQAAEALDYAHGMGIVHRDVKPANLLVDDRGNVWITDFGLAQFHAEASLTQTGDLLGTLRYMSPEQAGGLRVQIDHRTDIYSLGATLYELLTLQPIFDGAERQSLLQQILHEEPRPLRTVDRTVPPELETIVLKAVAKVPAERYASAHELAEDLQRFLRHEPILARRTTLAQRARKWFRRHPSVVAAGAILLALVALGSLLAAWIIRVEQEKTQQAADRAQLRAEEAEEQYRLARQSVDDMIRLAEDELGDHPHLQSLRKRLLEGALDYYQKFIARHGDDPNAQADLAATRDRVRKILADLTVLLGAGQFFLLNEEVVRDDLELSEEQRARFAELRERMARQGEELFREFHRLPQEERQRRFLDQACTNDAALAAILTPANRDRLRQIALQRRRAGVFRDPEIIAALKLTAEQRERFRAIEMEGFRPGPPPGEPPPGPPREPPGRQREQQQRLIMERIVALLTPPQAKRWQEMTGKPFKGVFISPGPGFPGPPPPGPRGPRERDS